MFYSLGPRSRDDQQQQQQQQLQQQQQQQQQRSDDDDDETRSKRHSDGRQSEVIQSLFSHTILMTTSMAFNKYSST